MTNIRHFAGNKDFMNSNTFGAARRPKLSLSFAGRTNQNRPVNIDQPSTLSGQDLRRIVAAMVD